MPRHYNMLIVTPAHSVTESTCFQHPCSLQCKAMQLWSWAWIERLGAKCGRTCSQRRGQDSGTQKCVPFPVRLFQPAFPPVFPSSSRAAGIFWSSAKCILSADPCMEAETTCGGSGDEAREPPCSSCAQSSPKACKPTGPNLSHENKLGHPLLFEVNKPPSKV